MAASETNDSDGINRHSRKVYTMSNILTQCPNCSHPCGPFDDEADSSFVCPECGKEAPILGNEIPGDHGPSSCAECRATLRPCDFDAERGSCSVLS